MECFLLGLKLSSGFITTDMKTNEVAIKAGFLESWS
jgi:hypothetical protein